MASRIALRASVSAARPRVAAASAAIPARSFSAAAPNLQQPPSERASELINKMPSSPGIVSKTGSVVLGTGVAAAAISQELYVVNEETVVLAGFILLAAYIARSLKEPYKQWAEGHIGRVKDILGKARSEHTQAVKDRIENVGKMKDVASMTDGLFALSKETAKLEFEVFERRQRVAMATEIKSVLDSWVRFEQQAKESEQTELAKAVIDKVMKTINDERTQKDILASAIAEVEQLVKSKAI